MIRPFLFGEAIYLGRPEGRCVGEGLLAAHQLGQQAARGRAKREALMAVPDMDPRSVLVRSRSYDRQHVGHTGTDATPGFGFDLRAEVDKSARRLLCRSRWIGRADFDGPPSSAAVVMRNPFDIGTSTYPNAGSCNGKLSVPPPLKCRW